MHRAREPSPRMASASDDGPTLPGSTPPFAQFFARLPGIVLVVDEQSRILYANHAVAGREPDQLMATAMIDLVPPPQRALVQSAILNAFHPGLSQAIQLPLGSGPEATWTWYQAEVAPMGIPGMRTAIFIGTDVTQRRRDELRLRHAEQLMVDTEGITHLGTWTWDITQPNAQWSAELYRIYGLDPKTHTPNYQDYLTRIHPDDVERVKKATDAVFNEHRPYSHDERIRRPDGSWRWLHTWAYPVLADGKLVALAGVCQDITEAKATEQALHKSEARLRALFEHSSAGLAVIDPMGTVVQANAALCALALRDRAEAVGQSLAHCLHPDERPLFEANLSHLRNARAGVARRMEARLLRPRGDAPLPVRLDLARIGDEGSEPFLFAIVQDASLETQAQESDRVAFARLLELRKLEETTERRTQLLRVASHEIKNPLTPVIVQLHMLQEGILGELSAKQARAVTIASKQVQRISHLLRDVLDVARIDQGRLTVEPTRVAVRALVQRVHDAYAQVASQWGITLESDAGDAWVRADAERLEQILVNLVSNALKFTPNGGHVWLHAVPERNGVAFQVRDTGPGLDATQVSRLFRPFSQVHTPGEAREEGSGLGLYICRSLAEAMNGTLEVDGRPGQGAAFTLWLPASTPPDAAAA